VTARRARRMNMNMRRREASLRTLTESMAAPAAPTCEVESGVTRTR
jgi:hypothetical protein